MLCQKYKGNIVEINKYICEQDSPLEYYEALLAKADEVEMRMKNNDPTLMIPVIRDCISKYMEDTRTARRN
jgi:hypothetical protein